MNFVAEIFFYSIRSGSEAAAATAVTIASSTAFFDQPSPIEFKANHSFLFFIRELNQNIVLFSGKLMAPTSSA